MNIFKLKKPKLLNRDLQVYLDTQLDPTKPKVIFHGGYHGYTRQWVEPEGIHFCIKC
jgi:hypothetical protein